MQRGLWVIEGGRTLSADCSGDSLVPLELALAYQEFNRQFHVILGQDLINRAMFHFIIVIGLFINRYEFGLLL